jgi:hypothetical protein
MNDFMEKIIFPFKSVSSLKNTRLFLIKIISGFDTVLAIQKLKKNQCFIVKIQSNIRILGYGFYAGRHK